MLNKLSSRRAEDIDKNNKVRLIRAIEIAKTLGDVPEIKEMPNKYDFILIGLDTNNKILKEKIQKRLLARMKLGMVSEVKNLHKKGVSWKRLESFGLEYRQVALFLQNKITKEQLIENLKKEIWNYVKRQRTWFKRNKNIEWFEPKDSNKILGYLKNKIQIFE